MYGCTVQYIKIVQEYINALTQISTRELIYHEIVLYISRLATARKHCIIKKSRVD